jgi:L-alanine-DL-glutamate epimerase-like enolase superfamily enzyme
MKITSVEPIFVGLPYEHGAPKPLLDGRPWDKQTILFVRVDTDEGVTGWGEAFSIHAAPVTIAAIREIVAKLAVGRDPRDVSGLMNELWRRLHSTARAGGPIAFALSGLDIALWDIAGKAEGKPVWKMLGGAGRDRIPVYASLFRTSTPEHVRRVAGEAAARGYSHVKLHEHEVDVIAAARETVGPQVSLMVDTNCHWAVPQDILDVCARIEVYDIAWLEEPLYPSDDYDRMAQIRAKVRVPLAAGENLGNINDFRWAIAAGAYDIVQPSAAKMGGVSGLWKAMAHARDAKAKAVPHSPFHGPALIAAVHVAAALPEDIVCEHRYCDIAASPLGEWVLARDGHLPLSHKPGLGFDVDENVVQRYRIG